MRRSIPILPVSGLPDAPAQAAKGRGTTVAIAHRFEARGRDAESDGWDQAPGQDPDQADAPAAPRTEVREQQVRQMLSRNDSPDIPFELAVNPYRGCEHGCIYCYARPTHAYLDLSPGLDFETRLVAKRNAVEVLERELGARGYRPSPIAVGSVTDAYQPVERDLRITRGILELFGRTRQPYTVITKSSGIERDLDLLAEAAAARRAHAALSITTLDPALARILEPRAASPQRRLQAVRRLAEAGVPVTVGIAPVIPFVNDGDIEAIVQAAAEAGAQAVFHIVLRLPWEVAPLFRHWLQTHFPQRAERVMARVQDLHGIDASLREGDDTRAPRDYAATFGQRFRGQGPWAQLLSQRVARAARRAGLAQRVRALDSTQFVAPRALLQPSLF
ncbi:MAG: PA0069 family radical SAM protein [Betaproteobacteria bacterium]|nr:PA0069 family radical SAM protein [Betaproteobacteria bacterium]MDE2152555.1 PA0069 family radical SAM protein [Betaproteobacteria bacterium]